MRLSHALLVALGGALGAVARYGVALSVARLAPGPFPAGTWTVNMVGAFAVGLVAPFVLTPQMEGWRLFVVVGVLGGFTTFSAFSLETLGLLRDGRPALAALNALGSVFLGLVLTAIGWRLARVLGAP
ncbi:MAG TPA: fluoride efflux transporter CrcB [Rhodothermales bacterium]|nr:fluoride efflux transporter CrcB [Rhodothermales bacterium]